MIRYPFIFLLSFLLSCSPSPAKVISEDANSTSPSGVNRSIAYLKSLYMGSLSPIVENCVIKGVVTGNDLWGEFVGSLIVEDDSGGIEIAVDLDNVAINYPVGSQVTLLCDGLYLGYNYGTLIIGSKPSVEEVVGDISESQLALRLSCSGDVLPAIPTMTTIDQLCDEMNLRYLFLERLEFASESTSYCDRDPETGRLISTTHRLIDEYGAVVNLFVPYTVEYGDVELPSSLVSISAILMGSFGGVYTLQLSDFGVKLELY